MTRHGTFLLFIAVIIIWGVNWTVTKLIVQTVPPIWATALRSAIAAAALLVIQLATRQFVIPKRGDISIILVVSLLHMIAFGTLMAVGLQYVSVGRSVVLGYTTPLWVTPAAWLLLREPMPPTRLIGVLLGICGLLVLFNPLALDWSDTRALTGNGLLLLASLLWAASILFVRAHTWVSTPFQLVFWQNLLATVVLSLAALALEGPLSFTPTPTLLVQFAYSGLLATAFGFWSVTVINKTLPAVMTSLCLLAVPVVGILSALIMIGEPLDLPLLAASGLILGGIALGAVAKGP